MTPPLDPKAEQERLAKLEKDIEEGRRHVDEIDTTNAEGVTFTGSDDHPAEEAVAEQADQPIDDAIAPPG